MHRKKSLAAKILKTSPGKIVFADDALPEIEKAITRSDFRGLIAVGKVAEKPSNYRSRGRARLIKSQKRKGRQRGRGSRKGGKHSLVSRKEQWISHIRAQRHFLQLLRDKRLLSSMNHRLLYAKSKGGFFRNVRHIKLYVTEHHLAEQQPAARPVALKK